MGNAAAADSAKLDALRALLGRLDSAIIAFSGGVDSTFLLRVAVDVPGLRCLAVTTDSPTTTAEETAEARQLAASFDAEHSAATRQIRPTVATFASKPSIPSANAWRMNAVTR
jgi:PP-loop superfamily ATP-utilizing enzyme